MSQKARITFPAGSAFHADLRARVDDYFTRTKKSPHANGAMVAKTAFWFSAFAVLYALMITLPFPFSLIASAVLGFTLSCIGFNIGHDAIHGAYSKNNLVNGALSMTFDILGAASSTWTVAHNQIHHSYTNVGGVDTDLDPGFWMRFYPKKEAPALLHRFQHIYEWVLYCFTTLVWVFVKDWAQLVEQKAPPKKIAGVVAGKVAHFAVFLVIPFLCGVHLVPLLCCYVLMLAASGLALATVFQLAHVVEGPIFASPPSSSLMERPWADHQLYTTANFGVTRLCTFITGGLDHQVEHHLLARVCHIHYRDLAPIVKQCALDHGLPYLHSGTFFEALASHSRVMKQLGAPHTSSATSSAALAGIDAVPG